MLDATKRKTHRAGRPWAQILQDQAKSKRPASPDKAEEWIMKQKAKRAAVFFCFPASVGFWLLSAVGFFASVGFLTLLAIQHIEE